MGPTAMIDLPVLLFFSLLPYRRSPSPHPQSPPATCPMSELTAAEAFSPPAKSKTARAWRTVLGFIGFLFQILIQALRGTPSLTQVLSFVGIRHPLLPSSSTAATFMPLPADTPPPPSAVADEESLDKLTVRSGHNQNTRK